jgi:hypothetical protein
VPADFAVGERLTAARLNTAINRHEPLYARVAVDQPLAVSSTTFQNVTALVVNLAPNTVYDLDLLLFWSAFNSASSGGMKIQFTGPAGATLTSSFLYTRPPTVTYNTTNPMGAISGMYGTGGIVPVGLRGWLTTSTVGGPLQLQAAQDAANATATIIRVDSTLTVRRMQ